MTRLDETIAVAVIPATPGAPAGKLADLELHFTEGALAGLKARTRARQVRRAIQSPRPSQPYVTSSAKPRSGA